MPARDPSMRIAWCSDRREFASFNAKVVDRVRRAGHQVTVMHEWRDLAEAPPEFDLGVLRTRDAMQDPECCQVAAALEAAGLPFLNSLRSRNTSKDKVATCEVFERAGIAQPAWLHPDRGSGSLSGPVIAKPRWGGRTEGVEVFTSLAEAMDGRSNPPTALFQSYVQDARVWRVIATRERTLRAHRKVALPAAPMRMARRSIRRSVTSPGAPLSGLRPLVASLAAELITAQGFLRVPARPPAAVATLARRMVAAVEGDLMGADVLLAADGPLGLEVNVNFGMQLHDRSLMKGFIGELERVSRQRGGRRMSVVQREQADVAA